MARRRRLWGWMVGILLGLALAAFLTVQTIATGIAESELGKLIGADVEIGSIDGLTGTDLTLRRVTIDIRDSVIKSVKVGRANAKLDHPLYKGDFGVTALDLDDVVVRLDLNALTKIQEKMQPGSPPEQTEGKDRPQTPTSPKHTAPQGAPEKEQPGLPAELVKVADGLPPSATVTNGTVLVACGGTPEPYVIRLTNLSATLLIKKGNVASLKEISGKVFQGNLSGNGDLNITRPEGWHIQLRVSDVDFAEVVKGTKVAETKSSGKLGLFIDLHGPVPGGTEPLGAGWVALQDSKAWGLPVMKGSLEAMGVKPGEDDELKSARARFRVDHGRCFFKELTAVGSPMSIYGNGSFKLDGTELEADLVPRFSANQVSKVPVVGQPSQVLLDVLKGTAVSIELRGSVHDPHISTTPVPVLTKPLRAFFSLVDGK